MSSSKTSFDNPHHRIYPTHRRRAYLVYGTHLRRETCFRFEHGNVGKPLHEAEDGSKHAQNGEAHFHPNGLANSHKKLRQNAVTATIPPLMIMVSGYARCSFMLHIE
jgi:hypothetical protein